MNYFLDAEFSERAGERPTIDLISLAIIDEKGNEYYWESSEFNEALCNDWVKENVLPKLNPPKLRKTRETIADEIKVIMSTDPEPIFWSYFGDYDWVVFCWLFGSMVNLPKHFPQLCMDLQQWWIQLGSPDIKPPPPAEEHIAIYDALWHKELYEALLAYSQRKTQ